MTKEQAIEAMRQGKKVTHTYFTDDEWMVLVPGDLVRFEDGVTMPLDEFLSYRKQRGWNWGWSIKETTLTRQQMQEREDQSEAREEYD